MKKIIIILLLSFKAAFVMAQSDTSFHHLPLARVNKPLLIINNRIIGGVEEINPKDVDSIKVVKESSGIPVSLKNLNKYGIVFIKLKSQVLIKTKSFQQIKDWMDISGPVKFAVDGFFVDDESLLIGTTSITEINVFKNADDKGNTVINVWTVTPEGQKEQIPDRKPGVIYIR